MNIRKNRLGLVALVVSSVMVLSACNGSGGKVTYTQEQMEEKIVAAFEAMEEVDNVRSNLFMEGTVEVDGEVVALDLDMSIAQEVLDRDEMIFNMDLDLAGNVSFEDYNVGFSMAMIMLPDMVYANLGEITGLEDNPNAAMFLPMLEGYMNQWWSFELPEGGLAGLGLPKDADITAQQEQLMEILKNTDFFESIKFAGSEKIAGSRAEKFDVVLSEDGLIEYVREVTALTDPDVEITEEEIAEVRAALQELELDASIWITDDGYIGGLSVVVAGEFEDEFETIVLDLVVNVEYSDFGKDLNIEAPADATLFDLGGLGLGAPAGFDPTAGAVDYDASAGIEYPEGFDPAAIPAY